MSGRGRGRVVVPVLYVISAGVLPMVTPVIHRRLGAGRARR